MLNALLITTGAIVVGGIVFARPLIEMYAGDFASVPGKLELTMQLTRVMLPFLTLVAVAAAVMGMLNSLHHYFVPALSPAMFNVATIAGAFVLVPLMPALGRPPIMAIALAALAGGFGQIAIQWPSLRREGFRYQPIFDPRDRRTAPRADADGPRHDRTRGDAGEPLRQHAARDEPGHRRRVVADVCVPSDVPADRRSSASRSAPRCCRRSRVMRRLAIRRGSATRCRAACG